MRRQVGPEKIMTVDRECEGNPLLTWLVEAEREILKRGSSGDLKIPDTPTDALRLLAEYSCAARAGFCRVVTNPDGFAQTINVLAFHEVLVPSEAWPFTQAEMRAELVEAGLSEWSHLPISHATILFLLSPGSYKYTLVTFRPSVDDLWLTMHAQASVSARIERGSGWQSAAIIWAAQLATGGVVNISVRTATSGATERAVPATFSVTASASGSSANAVGGDMSVTAPASDSGASASLPGFSVEVEAPTGLW